MEKLDEKLLKYCGIYKIHPTYEDTKKVFIKKQELENLTGLKIERIYVYGDSYWGKDDTYQDPFYCFLVDERLKTIDKVNGLVREYVEEKNDACILFWSLCQFEKRKQSKAELDYYIANYGYLLYDSKKEVEIDERIKSSQYSATMSEFTKYRRYYQSNEKDVFMKQLLEIYILKIGYYVDLTDLTVNDLMEYINYISNDKKIIELLAKYVKEQDTKVKKEMCNELEKYITTIKQEKINFKIPNKPTMQVYEKKKAEREQQGVLDIKTLTKEDEYIMYILEGKFTSEIAELYGIEPSEITKKNNGWQIRVKEGIISSDEFFKTISNLAIKSVYTNQEAISSIQNKGLLAFEKCIDPILRFMELGETYLLKEFWRFTNYARNAEEIDILGKTGGTWYRAALATNFLKNNGLIEEVEFKKYRITKLGRRLITDQLYETNTIDLLYILEELRHINLLGIDYILTDNFVQEDDRNRAILTNYEQLYQQQKEMNNTNVKQEEEQAEKELEKVRQKELEINSLEVPDKIQANCKIEAYVKSVGKRQKINEKKEKKTKNKVEISDQSKSTLGIKGEKYIYQNLVGENTNLLKQLGISKEDYEQIIFYNINYTQLKEDLSVGHGCDIEII